MMNSSINILKLCFKFQFINSHIFQHKEQFSDKSIAYCKEFLKMRHPSYSSYDHAVKTIFNHHIELFSFFLSCNIPHRVSCLLKKQLNMKVCVAILLFFYLYLYLGPHSVYLCSLRLFVSYFNNSCSKYEFLAI